MAYPKRESERIAYWERQIQYSTKIMEPYFEASRRIRNLYENEALTLREKQLDALAYQDPTQRVKPSIVFGWVDQSIANANARNPRFRVVPRNRVGAEAKPKVEAAVNTWWKETGQRHQDKRVLLDAFLGAFGVKKIGWAVDIMDDAGKENVQSEFTDLVLSDPEQENLWLSSGEPVKVLEDHPHTEHIESHTQALQQPDLTDDAEAALNDHIDEHRLYLETPPADQNIDVKRNAPFGIRWNPEDFRIDGLATDGLRDARWIAFRVSKPLDQIQANPNYKNTGKLKPTGRPPGAPDVSKDVFEDYDFVLLTLC